MAIYIALGSNLGDKEKNLKEALQFLEKKGISICRVSDFITTEPYGVTDQPAFLNAVAEIRTDKKPTELLHTLLAIEDLMGRKRIRRWGERNIDLDLLLYHDAIMQNRDFVLCPLAQVAPDAIHPILRKTIKELWEDFQARQILP